MFTGEVAAPVKMATFYTGGLMYVGDITDNGYIHAEDTIAEQVSNVVDMGDTVNVIQPFSLDIDLTDYEVDGETATMVMWEDLDDNDSIDPGEIASRLIADLEQGCPVFGESFFFVPVHWYYSESRADRGWNQSEGDWYVIAGDGEGASIESEYNFVQ